MGKISETLIKRTWVSVVNIIIPDELCCTGIIWDSIGESILLLTCYHSWKDIGVLGKGKNKRPKSHARIVHIKNDAMETLCTEPLKTDMFLFLSDEKDYAVIKFNCPLFINASQSAILLP